MKKVPIQELKRRLSAWVSEAASGKPILITRHKRVVAQLCAPDRHLHLGARFGKGRLEPLLRRGTKGRYLDVIADDRRGGWEER